MGSGLGSDVRGALRGLRTRAGLSATVIVTVALAIGATTSVFSVVNGVLLRPLDYDDPDRLVLAWQTRPEWADHSNSQLRAFAERFPLSVPTFVDWAAARADFESIGIYTGDRWVHRTAEGTEILSGMLVTSGIFDALGVEPALGRRIVPDDDRVGTPNVAVLSHSAWRDRFASDRGVLGRTLDLDAEPWVVVGVMPEGFAVPGWSVDVWTSLPDSEWNDERDSQSYTVLGRLRVGATVESAQADLFSIQERLSEEYPDAQGAMRARVEGLLDSMVGDVRSTLVFLLAAVGLVLVIACVNIANMLSVSGLTRRRELAVRAALGAGGGRLVRALLLESAVLAVLGGVAGLVVTRLTLPAMLALLPSSLPRSEAVGFDAGVLAFGVLVTGLTALLVGVLPAIQAARTQPAQMMATTSRGLAGGRTGERVRSALVVTEVALAFVLLLGAGLLGTSFLRLWNVDRGFSSEGLVVMALAPSPEEGPEQEAEETRRREELSASLAEIPGVRVSVSNQIPLSGSTSTTTYHIDRPDGSPEEANLMISLAGDQYFDVMEIALLEGRAFDASDGAEAPLVGIANQEMAARHWPGESVLGQTLRASEESPAVTIVGVAANVRHQGLHRAAEPKLYVPVSQNHRSANQWILRVEGDPAGVIELARATVARVSPTTAVRSFQILDERIAASVAVPRFRTILVVALAGMATILALLGVYGVITFAVSQRTRELAVRMAIGAHASDVVASTLRSGLRLSLAGVGVGAVLAWQAGAVLQQFLYEVEALNPAVYLGGAVVVCLVAVVASYLPARRAARVDPVTVLKAE